MASIVIDDQPGNTASEAFKTAAINAARRYARMTRRNLMDAVASLIEESSISFLPNILLVDALKVIAGLGSLDAAAALSAIGATDDEVATALTAVANRSPEIRDGFAIEGLTKILEESCEEEVAAGRMTKTVCPKTGRSLYSYIDGGGSD